MEAHVRHLQGRSYRAAAHEAHAQVKNLHKLMVRSRSAKLKLSMQCARCLTWIRGWDEWTGFKVRITAARLVKPDGELPRHRQLMERLAAIAGVLMCRFMAGFAQSVKQLRYLCVADLAVVKLVDQFGLGCVCFDSDTGVGRRMSGQEFPKLTEFDRGRGLSGMAPPP